MATFTGLSLDPIHHDLELNPDGQLRLVYDNEAIAQHVKQNLLFYRGEWFLDILAGVPWFQEVFVRPTNQVVIESVIKKAILDVVGVLELVSFNVEIDGKQRAINVLEAVARSTLDEELEILL